MKGPPRRLSGSFRSRQVATGSGLWSLALVALGLCALALWSTGTWQHWTVWKLRAREWTSAEAVADLEGPEDIQVVRDGMFQMMEAASLWELKVGCDAFRKKHAKLIEEYGQGGPDTWPPSSSFQNLSEPECPRMKSRHVAVLVVREAWLAPNWLEGFHACTRCGLTCQLSWSRASMPDPDAYLFVEHNIPPPRRIRGNPLHVYLSVEPRNWTNFQRYAHIGVGFEADRDVQTTYARPRESRQHFLASAKREDVLVYRATSNCESSWRTSLATSLLHHIPHHSFGACENNVGGRGKEVELYPHCRYLNGTRGPKVEWQEVSHCVLSHYKFVLAIESTRLPNYVSEKLYMPLETGTVPIYFGAPDVANMTPPDSYIDGDSFKSTEDLVKYINALNKDPVAYYNFFAWRHCGVLGHYTRARALSLDSLPCRLCEKISSVGGRNFEPTG